MKILLTGATGFLGWHTRVRLRALTDHEIIPVSRANWGSLVELAKNADAVIHIAGVNRGEPEKVEAGNVSLAQDVSLAVRSSSSVARLVYANSIQSGSDTHYGRGKEAAGALLLEAAREVEAQFTDVFLPNLFGEHGAPRYNSFVATFVEAVIAHTHPDIVDRQVELMHVQRAAQALIDGLGDRGGARHPAGTLNTVQGIYESLANFHQLYSNGDIPALSDTFTIDLFNTYRAGLFPRHYPITLVAHSDDRGRLVETVRSHGGQGQTFVSTTRPGFTRGDHFHLSKVERFVVLEGSARISLRRLFTDDIISFDVTGDVPAVVDMPTMWVHNITNIGDRDLTTLFWTHSLFDPDAPDTYWEPVSQTEKATP